MTTNRIDQIRRRLAERTPGKWEWRGGYLKGPYTSAQDEYYGTNNIIAVNYAARCPHLDVKENNATFIAHAPDDVEWLLAQVDLLQFQASNLFDENQRLREALRWYADSPLHDAGWRAREALKDE